MLIFKLSSFGMIFTKEEVQKVCGKGSEPKSVSDITSSGFHQCELMLLRLKSNTAGMPSVLFPFCPSWNLTK